MDSSADCASIKRVFIIKSVVATVAEQTFSETVDELVAYHIVDIHRCCAEETDHD
jgi:hypothetical protein